MFLSLCWPANIQQLIDTIYTKFMTELTILLKVIVSDLTTVNNILATSLMLVEKSPDSFVCTSISPKYKKWKCCFWVLFARKMSPAAFPNYDE